MHIIERRARIPGLICVSVLFGILLAGLVPFRRPRNNVTWLGNQNGLHFGSYGTVLSSGTFQVTGAHDEPSCSLEIWLQPSVTNASNTLLAFSTQENPLQLSVHQYRAMLILQRVNYSVERRTETIGIEGVFRQIKPIFITITSGVQKTLIYIDGNLAESFPRFRIENDCTGQLVIGTSPVGNERWSGELRGLAIYQRELTPTQVLQHYETWTARRRPEISENDDAMAVYLFDERAGYVVHNAVRPGIDLYIPIRYSLLHPKFLQPFWKEKEFVAARSYWSDILINIVGFIPLGFVFCAYWSSVRPIKHPALATVVLGFAVSLTIEVLQAYLPTRVSGTTDLITNTFGTFLGVNLFASEAAKAILARFN
jgi:VanZ family protein